MSRYFDAASGLPAATRGPPRARGRPRPRVGRSGPPAPRRPRRPTAARRRAGVRGRQPRGAAPGGHVHRLGDGCRPGRGARAGSRSAQGRLGVVASAVEHSAVLRAADWVGRRRRARRSSRSTLKVRLRSRLSGAPCAPPAWRWPACSTSTTRSARCSRSPTCTRRAAAAGVPLLVDACSSLGSLPAPPHWDVLVGQCAQVGRAGRRRRAGRPHRGPLAQPVAHRRGEAGRPASPTVPGDRGRGHRRWRPAMAELGRTQTHRARLLTVLRERVPQVADDVTVVGPRGRRRPAHRLLHRALRRRRGAGHRAGPGGLRGHAPARPARRTPAARATSWPRWARSRTATCASRCPRTSPRPTSPRS